MRPDKQLLVLAACSVVPSVLACGWFFHVGLTYMASPTRKFGYEVEGGERWQCHGMIWYLLLAPFVFMFAVASQAVWAIDYVPSTEKQVPMGRMLNTPSPDQATGGPRAAASARAGMASPVTRRTLLILEVVATLLGLALVFLSGGTSEVCEPEVWWASAVLVSMGLLGLLMMTLGAALVILALCTVGAVRIPWAKDVAASFWSGRRPAPSAAQGPSQRALPPGTLPPSLQLQQGGALPSMNPGSRAAPMPIMEAPGKYGGGPQYAVPSDLAYVGLSPATTPR